MKAKYCSNQRRLELNKTQESCDQTSFQKEIQTNENAKTNISERFLFKSVSASVAT